MALEIRSSAFSEGAEVPSKYTCDGADISPPLAWQGTPNGTKSFALIADDPDAPMGTWVHWVVWNVPSNVTALDENVATSPNGPFGSLQGITDFKKHGYGGPCPPSGVHRYYFKLYALDTTLALPTTSDKKALEAAMKGHILAQAQLMGKYDRK